MTPRRYAVVVACVLACAVGAATEAEAQVDFAGGWTALFHEDQPERLPGPALGDYVGLPINDSARAFAEAWDASRLTVPEHQCRAHSSPYILRGPLQLRIWEERNLQTQQIVALHQSISNFQQHRVIWMDGRPHPSPYAEHTWMGFSTGRFDGDALVVRTTHIKQMWHRRNGLPQSDRAVLTERYIRHGNILTHVSMTEDPDYLTEPLVKTTNMLLAPRELTPQQLIYPCESVVEIPDQQRGAVPHYQPGQNPYLEESRRRAELPEVGARGGAATMYPEFRSQLGRPLGK
jgi:hypothetical protein